MKKLCVIGLVVGIAALVASLSIAGNKYRKTPYEPPASNEVASDESVRSMADCMELSADHKSKGPAADKAEFKRQFGDPLSESASSIMYSYDKYTNIILKCRARSCDCMCLTKY
jgi:hypothetical protein